MIEQAGVAIAAGAVAMILAMIALAAFQRRGASEFRIGDRFGVEPATVSEWRGDRGAVYAGGELWRARSREALAAGDAVDVIRAEGLTLVVRKARASEQREDD